ncbi:MAG: hypothetical protein HY816_21190 [Candidatus Wallbacteria bacterium]|nr:hypothetical protein [Candidatus Wallbacteria bacterium]
MSVALVACLVGPWGMLAVWWVRSSVPGQKVNAELLGGLPVSDRGVIRGKPGPWGQLECSTVFTELPTNGGNTDTLPPNRWAFGKATREAALTVLRKAGVTPTQLQTLARSEAWKADPDGVLWLHPSADSVLSLTAEVRASLYSALEQIGANRPLRKRYACAVDRVDEWCRDSGLPEQYVRLFRHLLYRRDGYYVFEDLSSALSTIPSPQLQRLFVRMVTRQESIMANLVVLPSSDVEQISAYWEVGRQSKGLKELLRALRRLPGGGKVDVTHLLPPLARDLMHAVPHDSAPTSTSARADASGTWTSLNFFLAVPDQRFLDPILASKELQSKYTPLERPKRLGDLIVFMDANNNIVHMATYLAQDLVFSRVGDASGYCWVITTLDSLVGRFQVEHSPLRFRVAFSRSLQL